MHLAPEFTHHAPGHFRKPIINPGEQRENRSRRHDIMEVRDDVIGIVQMNVAEVEAERQSGQTADAEHRQKRQGEQHRRVKANRTAPQRDEQTRQNDHGGNRNDHRGGLEESADLGSHAGQIHMMRPDDEGKEPNGERRVNQRFITPDRLAGVVGDDFANNTHRRQNQHVHFRMSQEPEQMLPQQRTAAAADMAECPATADRSAGRNSYARPCPSTA